MKHMIDTSNTTACGGFCSPGDELVTSGLESDCIPCRGKFGIGPPEQRGCAVRETLNYKAGELLVDKDGKAIGRDKL